MSWTKCARSIGAGLVVVSALCAAPPVCAEIRLTDKEIQRLQTLSELGREACESGKYDSCHRIFVEAQSLLPWAPHQFYIGEALVGMGRMLEGIELWRQILSDNDDSSDPVTQQFVEQTRQRLAEEESQLPKLRLELDPKHAGEIRILLDGETADEATLSAGTALDPGKHVLEFSQKGYTQERHTLDLGRGSQEVLRVALTESIAPAQPPPQPHRQPQDTPRVGPKDDDWKMPVGVTLMVLGGASMLGSGAAFLLKEERLEQLRRDCNRQDPCVGLSEAQYDDRKARLEDRTEVMNVLFFGGAGLALGGAALVLLDVADDPDGASEGGLQTSLSGDGAWLGWQGAF